MPMALPATLLRAEPSSAALCAIGLEATEVIAWPPTSLPLLNADLRADVIFVSNFCYPLLLAFSAKTREPSAPALSILYCLGSILGAA